MSSRAQSYTFRDAKQQVVAMRMYFNDDAGSIADTLIQATAVATDLQALSNAVLESAHGPYTKAPQAVAAGTAAVYEEVEDKARFVLATAAGAIHRYEVPAPKSAIFLADGVTVDFTNSLVKQFLADLFALTFGGTAPSSGVITSLVSRDNKAVNLAIGGLRVRRPFIRRFSIYTRAPSGGQGE
jgi:hypothetical protein